MSQQVEHEPIFRGLAIRFNARTPSHYVESQLSPASAIRHLYETPEDQAPSPLHCGKGCTQATQQSFVGLLEWLLYIHKWWLRTPPEQHASFQQLYEVALSEVYFSELRSNEAVVAMTCEDDIGSILHKSERFTLSPQLWWVWEIPMFSSFLYIEEAARKVRPDEVEIGHSPLLLRWKPKVSKASSLSRIWSDVEVPSRSSSRTTAAKQPVFC